MKKLATLLAAALALSACADPPSAPRSAAGGAPRLTRAAGKKVPGSYVVLFTEDVTDVDATADELATRHGGRKKAAWKDALRGAAFEMAEADAALLATDPRVAEVEEEQEYTTQTTQSGATWGLDRIDQRSRPLSGTYTYSATGSAVYAYIIDTGIQTSHPQFGGRAAVSYDALGGNGQDCNGHGTHVAGTVGGSTYGAAKAVRLRAVRVLNCSGSGSTSGIISALNWLAAHHANPAVANMSLGGGYSSSLNSAVNGVASSGVFVAVAAGNENQSACNVSPASAANATTVASSTSGDAKSSFSNWGSCVDLYAPGSSITSAWIGSTTKTISGTSMATPHVTGVAALYKATYGNASYSTIRSWLTSNATANVISGNVTGTPNRLLYKAGL